MSILILAEDHGPTVDRVVAALREHGAEPLRHKVTHAHLLDDDDLADLSGIDLTCHLLQRYIDKQFDARCVVIGSRAFTVAIGPGPEGPETFWFLEANCRGQHGWLKRQTSLPLSAAIAELLIDADRA